MFKVKEKLKEMPLGYWEESSYMLVIPEDSKMGLLEGIFEKVDKIENVKILEKTPLSVKEPGSIKLSYEEEVYEIGFYPCAFSVPDFYINKNYYFKEEEIEKLKKAETALTIFMKFNENAQKSYHLELKIALAMVPDLIGIVDESAEKMMPRDWVKLAATSKILPGPNDLFTVQAVSGKKKEVWLHTHGLCRCGLTELEILNSNKENYNNHYHLISTFASHLMDKKDDLKKSAYIGLLQNGQKVVACYVPWTKGIKEYKHLTLGGEKDRKKGHNSKTSILFLYKSEEDEKNGIFTKVSFFDNLWKENPIFFISDEETDRMKALAKERFDFVKKEAKKKENHITLKIGLLDKNGGLEHIWFELLELKGNKIKAKLLQEPYNVENMHTEDIGSYGIEDVTDWIIYTPKFMVTPSTSYLLM